MHFKTISLQFDGPVARLAFANPPQNVITIAMMDELASAFAEIEGRKEISAMLISGQGKSFSAGVDVAAHTAETLREMLMKYHAVILAALGSKKVTVAEVRGNCLGGGAELAMVCDMVFTTIDARWGFPEITLGCFPPVACAALAACVGQKNAAELILSGATISGHRAAEIGLANASGSEEEVTAKVQDCLRSLARLSPASLATTKKALYTWNAAHTDKGLDRAEQIYLDELMKTEDAQEGIRAWIEKREPRWTGK